jgi:hypothetical protein
MSDIESAATPEAQAQAEKMGWIPPSRYKGEPERFVDADQYIERGETILPIVKEQNKRLHAQVDTLARQAQEQTAALLAAQEAIESLKEVHSVAVVRAAEEARMQLKLQLAQASENGDHLGVAELTDQLTKLNKEEAKPAPKPAPQAPAPFVVAPELKEWQAENPWYGSDRRKTALALGIAQDLRDKGETAVGRAFFELVGAEMKKELGIDQLEPASKVEGARSGSTDTRQSRASGKGFASLPKEAKDACDADAKKFVGKGKKYETQDAWRARYAQIYFGE